MFRYCKIIIAIQICCLDNLGANIFNFSRNKLQKKFYDECQARSLLLSSLKRLSSAHARSSRYAVYRAYKQVQAHYSCMRSKCTKFSYGTGGHVRDTRAPKPGRCVLCLFLAETCHMSLVPPFLVKSNGDTEVSPERQRFVNNSRSRVALRNSVWNSPPISEALIQFVRRAFDSLCQLLMAFHFEAKTTMRKKWNVLLGSGKEWEEKFYFCKSKKCLYSFEIIGLMISRKVKVREWRWWSNPARSPPFRTSKCVQAFPAIGPFHNVLRESVPPLEIHNQNCIKILKALTTVRRKVFVI